jgi:hypothetical protein
MRETLLAVIVLGISASADAQPVSSPSGPAIPPEAKTVSLAGPRFGVTVLNDRMLEKLHERRIDVGSTISQFGWQFERQFYSRHEGPTILNEWVVLVGGLEQGTAIPSVSWLVGMRTKEGAEFGLGPNITPGGVALAVAAGVTFRAGIVNIPMTFAAVPSKYGTRVSLLSGFVLKR